MILFDFKDARADGRSLECGGIQNPAKKILKFFNSKNFQFFLLNKLKICPVKKKRFTKKVISGQPTGPNIMWLCDKGEYTHATIEGEKKTIILTHATIGEKKLSFLSKFLTIYFGVKISQYISPNQTKLCI